MQRSYAREISSCWSRVDVISCDGRLIRMQILACEWNLPLPESPSYVKNNRWALPRMSIGRSDNNGFSKESVMMDMAKRHHSISNITNWKILISKKASSFYSTLWIETHALSKRWYWITWGWHWSYATSGIIREGMEIGFWRHHCSCSGVFQKELYGGPYALAYGMLADGQVLLFVKKLYPCR